MRLRGSSLGTEVPDAARTVVVSLLLTNSSVFTSERKVGRIGRAEGAAAVPVAASALLSIPPLVTLPRNAGQALGRARHARHLLRRESRRLLLGSTETQAHRMTRRKVNVQQEVFGFADEDLKTSLHDEIVLWLKHNAALIGKRLVAWEPQWKPDVLEELLAKALVHDEQRLEQLRGRTTLHMFERDLPQEVAAKRSELQFLQQWNGLGEPPEPEFSVDSQMERPIQRERYQTVDIVGYADVVFWVKATRITAGYAPTSQHGEIQLGIDPKTYATWHVTWRDLGSFAFDAKSEIRSLGELIRQFRTYRVFSKFPFYAVSPDARFAQDISDGGFGFVQYPDGHITFPKEKS